MKLSHRKNKIKDILYNFTNLISSEFLSIPNNLCKIYKTSKTKSLLVITSIVLILVAYTLLVLLNEEKRETRTTTSATNTLKNKSQTSSQEEIEIYEENIGSNYDKKFLIGFLDTYDQIISLIKPLLDGFISHTPDVTGVTESSGDFLIINNIKTVKASTLFYEKTLKIAYLILIILLISSTLKFMTSDNEVSGSNFIKHNIYRIILIAFFMITGKLILSYSIQFSNSVSAYFFGGESLTSFIQSFSNSVRNSLGNIEKDSFAEKLLNIFSLGTQNFTSFLKMSPIIIPLILILLFLIFISFQFINRFISLYFLAPLLPLASVFLFYPKTTPIFENYWKVWFTLLIHQPFFILGFAITQSILLEGVRADPSFEAIIIFLAGLIFLSTINVLVGKIFADTWTAVSNNLQAAAGSAALMKGMKFISSPIKKAGGTVKDSILRESIRRVPPLERNKKDIPSQKDNPSSQKSKSLSQPPPSEFVTALKSKGYEVNSYNNKDNLNLSGNFYARRRKDNLTSLYTSFNDAIKDGAKLDEINKVHLDKLSLVDTSNPKTRKIYNNSMKPYALENGYQSVDVNLRKNSPYARIKRGLISSKTSNNLNSIDGVIVRRYPKNIDRKNPMSKKQLQIQVYTDKI